MVNVVVWGVFVDPGHMLIRDYDIDFVLCPKNKPETAL